MRPVQLVAASRTVRSATVMPRSPNIDRCSNASRQFFHVGVWSQRAAGRPPKLVHKAISGQTNFTSPRSRGCLVAAKAGASTLKHWP